MEKQPLDDILQRLHGLQREFEQEIDRLLKEKSQQFQYTFEQGKVRFERQMLLLLKKQRTGLWEYIRGIPLRHLLSAPLVYSLFIPFALLDASVTLFQQICFRLYRIPLVRRSDYLIHDRQHLAYLNAIEKLNCIYCGYANGVSAYVREVAGRTEQYWCPIKHARRSLEPHRHVENFVDHGDVKDFQNRLTELRQDLSRLGNQEN